MVAKRAVDPETNKLVVVSVKTNPLVGQVNASWMIMRAFCSEFGLSPVSRTRPVVDKPDDGEDELMEILSQPRERKQPREVIQ